MYSFNKVSIKCSFNKISEDSLFNVVRALKSELLLIIIIYYYYLNLQILCAYIIYTWFDLYIAPMYVNMYVHLYAFLMVWSLFLCFLIKFQNYLFSTYFLLFYYYSLYVCYFSKERQKGSSSRLEWRCRRSKETVMKKIFCQQKNKRTKSFNMINLSSFQRSGDDSTCHTT